jgi:hypothetical protein
VTKDQVHYGSIHPVTLVDHEPRHTGRLVGAAAVGIPLLLLLVLAALDRLRAG